MKTIDDLIQEIDVCEYQIAFLQQFETSFLSSVRQAFDSQIQSLIREQDKLKQELAEIRDNDNELPKE